jgi:predicted permease
METLLQDVRYALRALLRAPAFTVVSIVTLALGIGATTAIFSAIHAVLLTPPPVAAPDRVAMVWMDNSAFTVRQDITSYPNFVDWRARNLVFEELAAFRAGQRNLTGAADEAERLAVTSVGASYFPVLGVAPQLGRGFSAEEEELGNHRVAVLGHGLWQRLFGGDPGVLGQQVRLNDLEFTVVGVMPAGFDLPEATQLWVPLAPSEALRENRNAFWVYVVGRLRPGVTPAAAQADMDRVAAELNEEYPTAAPGSGIYVQPLPDYLTGAARPALLVLFGAVGFLLLIACANVANLFLARALGREREMAVRAAVGASRLRLTWHLLAESTVLGLLGGAGGVLVAYWGVALLRRLAPADLPGLDGLGLSLPVLGFALLLAVGTGLAFGMAPALRVSRPASSEALRAGGRGGSAGRTANRFRKGLVVGQVALALVLLVGAGLLIQSFRQLRQVDTGFRAENVLTARIALAGQNYAGSERAVAFYEELLQRVESLPGVVSAAATSGVLLSELPASVLVTAEGREPRPGEEGIEIPFDVVTPGYFATVGTPLLRGRDFGPGDREGGEPVAVVNEAMARLYWDGDALGRRFRPGGPEDNDQPWITVIGVVADARRTALEQEARPSSFFPLAQFASSSLTLAVRTAGDPMGLAQPLRAEVRAMDPGIPVTEVSTLEAQIGERISHRRFTALLLGLFSALALVLALVGVYGVVAYLARERTREIGIRLALGARPVDVLRLVSVQVLALVGGGVLAGLIAAALLARSLTTLLYQVRTTEPLVYALVASAMLLVAVLASYLPARAATRVEPTVALRSE